MRSIKFLIILLFLSGIVFSQNGDHINIAKKISIKSSVLGEERTIYVSTPANYNQTNESYPVLYLLSGSRPNILFTSALIEELSRRNLCPKLIVVTIKLNRFWDTTPTKSNKDWAGKVRNWPGGTGGADKFLKFIKTELFPFVEKKYRTLPYRIFSGHSAGGMCVTHAFLSHNTMFNGYIAISPSLWWDNTLFLHTADEKIGKMNLKHKTFYFTMGSKESPDKIKNGHILSKTLSKKAPAQLRWSFDFIKNEDHNSQGTIALYNGMRFIYKDWKFDSTKVIEGGLSYINNLYLNKSKKYGYEIFPSEGEMISFGYRMIRNKKLDEAIKIFKMNILKHPNSANAYDCLGEAYLAAGKIDISIKNYEKAVELGTSQKDENLALYKQGLKKAKERKRR